MKVKQPVLVKGTSHVYTKRPLVTGGCRYQDDCVTTLYINI